MNKKTIVVVGAGKGLGNAVARLFGENDFRVILISRNLDRLNGYKAEFETAGIETYVYAADCEKPETLTEAFKEIQGTFDAVDVLVYNAAVLEGGTATEFDNANFLRHYQVDVASALHCTKPGHGGYADHASACRQHGLAVEEDSCQRQSRLP